MLMLGDKNDCTISHSASRYITKEYTFVCALPSRFVHLFTVVLIASTFAYLVEILAALHVLDVLQVSWFSGDFGYHMSCEKFGYMHHPAAINFALHV